MRVFLDDGGEKRMIGTADISADHGPVYEARLFGAKSIIVETFTIGTITHLKPAGPCVTERVVLVAPGQAPSVLPRWQPLPREGECAGTLVGVRLQPEALAALDAWISRHARHASRPEAIRALIERGMKAQDDIGE